MCAYLSGNTCSGMKYENSQLYVLGPWECIEKSVTYLHVLDDFVLEIKRKLHVIVELCVIMLKLFCTICKKFLLENIFHVLSLPYFLCLLLVYIDLITDFKMEWIKIYLGMITMLFCLWQVEQVWTGYWRPWETSPRSDCSRLMPTYPRNSR